MQVTRFLVQSLILSALVCTADMQPGSADEPVNASWRLAKPEAKEGPRNEAVVALDESWADYGVAVARASEKLLKLFETVIAAATKKGDLGSVQSFTEAQTAFVEQGTLPADKNFLSAVAGLKKQVATANTALMRSYTKAVATLTKNGDVEQAKRLQAEQHSVFAGVAVAGGPRKAAVIPWVVDLTNEATLKKEWVLEGKYDLQVVPQAGGAASQIKLHAGASMTTLAKYEGDQTIQLVFEKGPLGDLTIFTISAWGINLDFREQGKHRLEVRRKGNQLMYSLDSKTPNTVAIKDNHLPKPSAVALTCRGLGGAAGVMSCTLGPIVIIGQIADEPPQSAE